jgi:NADPH:quinone reductase-like Zn-dependent oxidoreductase
LWALIYAYFILGTGGLSVTALTFAKAAGAVTIITSSSDEKLQYVKSTLGADFTINYNTHPDWAAEVRRITNGRGAEHVLDIAGAATIQQSIDSVAHGGVVSVLSLRTNGTENKILDLTTLVHIKACVVRGIMGGSKEQLEEAVRFIGNRGLSLPVSKTFRFNRDDIIAALEHVASGNHVGKVCVTLD